MFYFSPLFGEDDSHFDLYFFEWVETTNQISRVRLTPFIDS